MNDREVDAVLDATRATIVEKVRKTLAEISQSYFATSELIALEAMIRPVWERTHEPAPVYKLELVSNEELWE